MAQFTLIHGYGTKYNSLFIKKKGKDGGFFGFGEYIDSGLAKAFQRGVEKNIVGRDNINPTTYTTIYSKEKTLTKDPILLDRLYHFIEQEKSHTLISHSMGCYFVNNLIEYRGLPSSVQKIIFIQGDIDRKKINNIAHITIENYYCWWDITLYCSMIINRYLPAGLFGSHNPTHHNVFAPLYILPNLHTSTISDKRFARTLIKNNQQSDQTC